jgi:hypothetical protein
MTTFSLLKSLRLGDPVGTAMFQITLIILVQITANPLLPLTFRV